MRTLHSRQLLDPHVCFSSSNLQRRTADVQRSAGTSPHVSFSGLILRSLQLHPRFEIFHTGVDEECRVLGCDVIEIVIRVCVSAFQRDLLHPSSG